MIKASIPTKNPHPHEPVVAVAPTEPMLTALPRPFISFALFLAKAVKASIEEAPRVQQSPIWSSVRDARNEMKAARESGQVSSLIKFGYFTCKTCTIGIGPDHVEKSVYLFQSKGRVVCLGDKKTRTFPDAVFVVCGGCARNYHVPEVDRIIADNDWKQVVLLLLKTDPEVLGELDEGKRTAKVLEKMRLEMSHRVLVGLEDRGAIAPKKVEKAVRKPQPTPVPIAATSTHTNTSSVYTLVAPRLFTPPITPLAASNGNIPLVMPNTKKTLKQQPMTTNFRQPQMLQQNRLTEATSYV